MNKPYSLFLFAAVIFLFVYALHRNSSIDIKVNGTYYTLIARKALLWMFVEFLLAWLAYIALERSLFSRTLTWLHTTGTLLVVMIIYSYQSQNGVIGRLVKIGTYHRHRLQEHEYYVMPYSGILLLALILLQGLFIYNVVKGRQLKGDWR